jgi:hypothetical protein
MTCAVIVLAVLASFRGDSAHAATFPDADPTRERELLGAVEADQLGTWARDGLDGTVSVTSPEASARPRPGVVLLAGPAAGDLSFYLPKTPEALVCDGLVRARLVTGSHPDFSLLVRASVSATEPEELEAYGLSVQSDGSVRLHRWHRGIANALGPAIHVEQLATHVHIEIVVMLTGEWIAAQVYDADSLEELASLAVRDPALSWGRVGLRADPGQGADTCLESLSVARAAAVAPKPARANATWEPVGDEVLMNLDPGDRARLPADLAGACIAKEGSPTTPGAPPTQETWLRTDRFGLERTRRAGVRPLSLTDEIPWWALDSRYRAHMGHPPTPTATGFRLDESYKDPEMTEALLRGYAAAHAEVARLVEIGRSNEGRPILGLRIAAGVPGGPPPEGTMLDRPAVLLMAAHHASELLTIEFAFDAARQLLESTDERTRRWLRTLDTWVVPLVNPDGNHAFLQQSKDVSRKNRRDADGDGRLEPFEGVDLNRNYPFHWGSLGEKASRSWRFHYRYRGPSPASEPEVKALMALAGNERFIAAISWHTNATAVLSPYTIDDARTPEPDVAWLVARPLVDRLPVQPNGKRFRLLRKLYPVDGTDQDWFFHEWGTLAYNVEGSMHNPLDPAIERRAIDGQRPFWVGLLDRVVSGPRISGHVLGPSGPLEAEVMIEEIHTFEGESWKSRPGDGRFDRIVPAPGTYTLRIHAPGLPEARRKVNVRDVADEEIRLGTP